jgi:gluconate 2-dehydrogenase gamma chain
MSSSDADQDDISRRSFLLSGGGLLSSVWIAAHWPAIAAAAQHAEDASAGPAATGFAFLDAAEAADVEAICAQIVPSGATPGARETHVVYFIDRALATFFSRLAPDFRAGLTQFRAEYRASNPAPGSFAEGGPDAQIAFLKTVDSRPFFDAVRTLTLLGMFASPKYGGNVGGAGWKLMGFADQHAFTPPFGFYDREYAGFVPYPTEKPA